MEPFRRLSTSEQLAEHLRRQILNGTLRGVLPGVQQLVKTLGVNSMAVGKAVQQLEREGVVLYQGGRKSRLIAEIPSIKQTRLRVGILNYSESSAIRHDILSARQGLMDAGHEVVVCPKSMRDMRMNVDRVARAIQAVSADAWIIGAGSSEILKWFEQQGKPAFALHGRQMSVKMAGAMIRKLPMIAELIEKLVGFGHRRIVLLTPEYRRKPQLGFFERSFMEILETNGIGTGSYNVPDWDQTPEGLEHILHSLFQATPPTALFVSDPVMVHATHLHLQSRGIEAPRDVSLLCNDFAESLLWTRPGITHIRWDHRPVVRRIVKWANHIAKGASDTRKSFFKPQLVEGGTIGPVRKGR
jgi:DNA-binding LacI/PurR family transcriptional regulator